MNILILGGCGFLGRNCAKKLSEQHKIYIIDRFISQPDLYESYSINLTDTNKIIELIKIKKIDLVMHFVSSLIPSSNYEQFLEDNKNVYFPTINLLEYCAENKIKFLYLSSGGAVYGNQKEIFNEHTKREPVSYYGLSKLNFENAITFYHYTKGLEYLIIRPSNPYGAGQNTYGKQGIIAVIIGKILKNETIEIWGDGSAIKDYIYIDDFVFYINELVNKQIAWNNVYNIGSGVGVSVNEVLNTFKNNQITLPEIKYINASNSDVKRMILDCTKLQDLINHKCHTLSEGVKKFWDFANEK